MAWERPAFSWRQAFKTKRPHQPQTKVFAGLATLLVRKGNLKPQCPNLGEKWRRVVSGKIFASVTKGE